MPLTFWVLMGLAAFVLVSLGVVSLRDSVHDKRHGDQDESWRDDYTGWG